MTQAAGAFGPDAARELARTLYGLDVEARPLPGEKDLNFRLRGADGVQHVLKVHHADADRAELALQDAALAHIAAQPQAPPAPRVVPTSGGEASGRIGAGGDERVVRLLTWLDGRPWADAGRPDAARVADLGRHVALVDGALADFRHPAMTRDLLWNLISAPAVAQLVDFVDAAKRPAVEAVFARHAEHVVPRLAALPHQVIHNDANELNVLVDDAGAVAGLIDFGDVVWSARVCGLAVAAAYAMQGEDDPLGAIMPLVYGYDQAVPLTVGELEVAFDLMRTRLAMSICMSAWQHAADPDNDYLLISQEGVWGALRAVGAIDADLAHFRLRDACGYEANPRARAVRQHFESGVARPREALVDAADRTVPRALRHGARSDDGEAIQLGVGLVGGVGESVFAPLDGTVAACADSTVVLAHETTGGTPFWTAVGGLAAAAGVVAGAAVAAGDTIGRLAPPATLRLQLLTARLGGQAGPRESAPAADADLWLSVSADPNLLLGRRDGDADPVAPDAAALIRRRTTNLSRAMSLSYAEPLHIVRGAGAYLYDEHDRPWLDLVNNVGHVGHGHPRVVAAGQRQMAMLNTNTRYLHDAVVGYARRLVATLPDPLRVVMFVNSGSEANDLALRLATAHTGRSDVLVLDHAYHGHLTSQVALSPYKFNRRGGQGRPPGTHVCELPDPYRGRLRGAAATGPAYAASVHERLRELSDAGRGPAAFFVESLQSCGGQIVYPEGYLSAAFGAVRDAGGVCVADEVQVGFGRVGRHFWGFELQDVVPDIVTLGKPMGNGHPLAAVVTTPAVATSFVTGMEYFNTFGGNPVSAQVGLAVLDVLRDEGLQAHAADVGAHLIDGLRELAGVHELIGDVRGEGLFLGVELSVDHATRAPATRAAAAVKEAVKARGILISTDGPDDNVLKIKPPLVVSRDDADLFLEALDDALAGL